MQFYNPENDTEGFINKLVAAADPPFCHVELHLPNDWACSIFMHNQVHFRKRTFKNPAYETVKLVCTSEQIQHLEQLIQEIMDAELKFSMSAMIGSYYGINLCPDGYTFCSKLVGELLQKIGVLDENVDCNVLSPSKLYRILTTLPTRLPPQPVRKPTQYCTIDWNGETQVQHTKLSFSRKR